MKKRSPAITHEIHNLTDNAKALLAATAHVAEDKVVEARQRLTTALDQGRETWELAKDKASEGVDSANEVIHDHPYKAVGISFGVGALIGCLIARR